MNTRTQIFSASDRRRAHAAAVACRAALCCALAALTAVSAYAGPREQAKRIHERLTGVAPTDSVLASMESDVGGGNATAAALTAMQAPTFYSVTLKNFATPWTNRDQTVFAPLNDYTATVIGMVRDDVDFNTVLSDDILYTGRGGLAGVPAYSTTNNAHYDALETQQRRTCEHRRLRAPDAVRAQRPAGRGDRRHHHFARRRGSVLHRRHQPRDVPLHADEPPVPRHGAGAGHQRVRRIASART